MDIDQPMKPGTSSEIYQHTREVIGSPAQGTMAVAKRRAVGWDLTHTTQPLNRGLIHRVSRSWSDYSRIVPLQLQSKECRYPGSAARVIILLLDSQCRGGIDIYQSLDT